MFIKNDYSYGYGYGHSYGYGYGYGYDYTADYYSDYTDDYYSDYGYDYTDDYYSDSDDYAVTLTCLCKRLGGAADGCSPFLGVKLWRHISRMYKGHSERDAHCFLTNR
jgi:hypothetical protein